MTTNFLNIYRMTTNFLNMYRMTTNFLNMYRMTTNFFRTTPLVVLLLLCDACMAQYGEGGLEI
jgi:hypothetical protein